VPQAGKILGQKVKEGELKAWKQKEHQGGVGAGDIQERKAVALMQEEWST